MEKGDEEEVSSGQIQQNTGGSPVEKPNKIFITDDEGIGDSESNTPRPGSSMADYHLSASPEPSSNIQVTETQPLPDLKSSESEPQPSSDTPDPESEIQTQAEHHSAESTPRSQSQPQSPEHHPSPELQQPNADVQQDSPPPPPAPGDNLSEHTEKSEESCPQTSEVEPNEECDTKIEAQDNTDQQNNEVCDDHFSLSGKSETFSETDANAPRELKNQDSARSVTPEAPLKNPETEENSPCPDERLSPLASEIPSHPEESPSHTSEHHVPDTTGSPNQNDQSSSQISEEPVPQDMNEIVAEGLQSSHAPENHQMTFSTYEEPVSSQTLDNHASPKDSPIHNKQPSSPPLQNHVSQDSSSTVDEPTPPLTPERNVSRESSSISNEQTSQNQDNHASRKSSSVSNEPVSPKTVGNHVSKRKSSPVSNDPPPSQSLENIVSNQLQQVTTALQDYHSKLSAKESLVEVDDDEKLKKTLTMVTAICQTCCSTSAVLGKQLQQARQLTDNISKDLTDKLHSVDLKGCLPLGYCVEEGESLPEERQAAERKRMARAAEARAAIAHASHALQVKAQELASAEAELMEAELAAAAAVEVAEEAILQLKASKAAEEAKQKQEEAEENENVTGEETTEQEGDTEENEMQNTHENGPQTLEEGEGEPENNEEQEFQAEEETKDGENVQEDGADIPDSVAYPQEVNGEQEGQLAQNEDTVEAETEENATTDGVQQEEGRPDTHIDLVDVLPEQQPGPQLTTQKVFQEVHLVQESQESFPVHEEQSSGNWSRLIYSMDAGDWDTGLGCVVRADGQRLGHDDLEVSGVLSARAALVLRDGEELISNVITLGPSAGRQEQASDGCFSPFLLVSLPHCAPRLYPGREPVVRMRPLDSGGWRDLETNDVTFDDIREHKFVEARVREPGTLCVVLRMKREGVQITPRHGGKFMASADSRVTLTWSPYTVNGTANVTVAVQPLDQNVVTELRLNTDMDCSHLMSSSPILHCSSQGPALLQPLVFTLPCPPNPAARPARPATSVTRKVEKAPEKGDEGGGQRPATARPFLSSSTAKKTEEVAEEELHVLWRQEAGTWSKLTDAQFLHSKKKDLVIFEMHDIVHRSLLLRTRSGLSTSVVERTACILEHMLALHPVHLVLRQHVHLPHQVTLTYCSPHNLERALRTLAEEGYSQGPAPTNEIKLREGQVIELSFRGNLKPTDEMEFVPLCAFHNNIPFRAQFCVAEIDEFAQKGFPSYRGFVQFTTTYTTPFRRRESTATTGPMVFGEGGGSAGSPACFVSGTHLVAELLASLPKPDPQTPRPLTTAPVSLKSHGPITNELLRHVAQQLAADDWRRLVPMLNIRRTRLQAILRQNMTTPPWLPVYDVLLTWSKRLPQSFDRVEMLCAALMAVGRNDLVEEVRDKDHHFRQDQALSTREVLLNKAFVRIARHEKAVSQWRRLALFLGVSEDQVKAISDHTRSARERCMQSLQLWKNTQDDSGEAMATVTLLSHKLRLCRYRALAREIESIR